MKRTLFLILAAVAAVFAVLVAADVVNFETDRLDRWVMIFSFAGVAFFVGLASADATSNEDEPTSARAIAAEQMGMNRPAPSDLPSKPGSLHRTPPAAAFEEPVVELVAIEPDVVSIDPVDAELQEMIDDDQMHEIAALVDDALPEESPTEDTAEPTESRTAETSAVDTRGSDAITLAGSEGEPLARLELRLADYDDAALERVVKESESVVIAEMVRTGQLTSEGHLTERDVASMVFLAYTSEEMLAELRLRKALDQPGDVAVTGRDLAPLKNIE